MDKSERHSRQGEKWPLWEKAGGDQQLAAAADRAFNFAVFRNLDSEWLSFRCDADAGKKRVRLRSSLTWYFHGSRVPAWSGLWGGTFLCGILRNECTQPQIECALRTHHGLDHLVDLNWFGQHRRRS